jgi:ankyrin repeat protein
LAHIRKYVRKHGILSQTIRNGSASLVVFLAVDLQLDLNLKEAIPGTSEPPMHPLIRAVNMSSLSITRCLIVHGADPDIMDENGYTPLMHAARDGMDGVARCLMQLGADPLSQNPITEETPLSIAQEHEDVYMEKLIMSFAKIYL